MLAILFLGAGISHFTSMQRFFRAIVPKGLPNPNGIVALTGVMELLAGIGLIIPVTAPWTGIALILFLIAVFPANIEAARQHLPYSNPLWVRAAAQVVLIGLVAWAR
jgi:uncharacterized membrane protein